jgi:signal transduction histidine kinase
LDVVWLLLLAGLAVLPPIREIHKQLILLAFGVVQVIEHRMVTRYAPRGAVLQVVVKMGLAMLLVAHTAPNGEPSINSSYYPIFYLPIVTAALYFGPRATLLWTLVASASYCSFLYPIRMEYQVTADSITELATRILFFFLFGLLVNRFAVENREQTRLYQQLAEQLAETNRQLERAQAEARRSERLAALGQLSAGLAHEIRNPLGVIKGSAEMLTQKLKTADVLSAELAGYISSEVNRVSALVTRFLDFARPLHADRKLQPLAPLLERSLKSVADAWQGGPIEVQRNYETGLVDIPLDEGLCEQAFVNLIQNAYQAMEKGGTLYVSAARAQKNSRTGIEVRLRDTGPGVPPDQREQIFNPFFTTKQSGVGLGLSIVSKILDEHRGTIRVEGAPGEGACFVLFFPGDKNASKEVTLRP